MATHRVPWFSSLVSLLGSAFFFAGLIFWFTGCPSPTTGEKTTEKAAEKTAEKTADGSTEATPETTTDTTPETTTDTTPETTTDTAQTVYQRLGEEKGIQAVVGDFINRVVADSKINGYFLNGRIDGMKLLGCLVKQIGQATGGPQKYDCRSMKETHTGMKVSKQDFADLVGHMLDALSAAKVAQADIDVIATVLLPMEGDIVEDTDNNKTVYQRVGRRPAITAVVTDFIGRVSGDATINSFFANANGERLMTCLVRQVCSIDGPCRYGDEPANGEKGATNTKPCLDMKTVHRGLKIATQDFTTLMGHLVDALKAAKVAEADITTLGGVLGTMCPDIVEVDANNCP